MNFEFDFAADESRVMANLSVFTVRSDNNIIRNDALPLKTNHSFTGTDG